MWEQKFLSEKLALIHEFSGLKSKLLTLQFIWCHFEAILDGYRKYIICCYTNICMSFHSINFVLHLFLILFFSKYPYNIHTYCFESWLKPTQIGNMGFHCCPCLLATSMTFGNAQGSEWKRACSPPFCLQVCPEQKSPVYTKFTYF